MTDQDQQQDQTGADEHIVTLQDENGSDVTFEHLMTLEYKGASYILLEAQQDMEDCLQGESIILKIETDKNGDDLYVTIEDEAEYQEVFEKCLAALEEQESGEQENTDGGEE